MGRRRLDSRARRRRKDLQLLSRRRRPRTPRRRRAQGPPLRHRRSGEDSLLRVRDALGRRRRDRRGPASRLPFRRRTQTRRRHLLRRALRAARHHHARQGRHHPRLSWRLQHRHRTPALPPPRPSPRPRRPVLRPLRLARAKSKLILPGLRPLHHLRSMGHPHCPGQGPRRGNSSCRSRPRQNPRGPRLDAPLGPTPTGRLRRGDRPRGRLNSLCPSSLRRRLSPSLSKGEIARGQV
mmetsp:Transcript_10919/g.34792  ORF Transcript_10919/g.34792 Transcript_10919/m.34792 type:complete len:237 (+) Transcript_10919:403-1113(+)